MTTTSRRERLLWGAAALTLVGIVASLALVRTLADVIGRRDLIDELFVLGLVLVLVAIAVSAFRFRPRGIEVGAIVGVLAVYLIVFLRMSIPEERGHLIEYSVLSFLVYEALWERRRNGVPGRPPWVLAVAATSAAGVLDEVIQLFIPDRVFDARDIVFNILAVVLAVALSAVLARARARFNR